MGSSCRSTKILYQNARFDCEKLFLHTQSVHLNEFLFSVQIQGRLRSFITVKQKRAINILPSLFVPLENFSFQQRIAGAIQVYLITTTKRINVTRLGRRVHVQIMVTSSLEVAMIRMRHVDVRLDMS